MNAPVTAIYAFSLTLLFIGLGMRVAMLRLTKRIGVGDEGNKSLMMAVGARGNAAENIPLALLLLFMLELQGNAAWVLHTCGGVLLLSRCIHAWGVSTHPFLSFGRLGGMMGTWGTIGGHERPVPGLLVCRTQGQGREQSAPGPDTPFSAAGENQTRFSQPVRRFGYTEMALT